MATYDVLSPEGREGTVEAPDGLTHAQLSRLLQAQYGDQVLAAPPPEPPPPPPKPEGTASHLLRVAGDSTMHFLKDTASGVADAFRSSEELNAEAPARIAAREAQQKADLEKYGTPQRPSIAKTYREQGFLPAVKETVRQAPETIAENIGPLAAGAVGMGMASGYGAIPSLAVAGLTMLPAIFKQFNDEQAIADKERGEEVDIDRAKSGAAAVASAAVMGLIQKIPGLKVMPEAQPLLKLLSSPNAPIAQKLAASDALQKMAAKVMQDGTGKAMMRGAGRSVVADPALMAGNVALGRAQAGKSLTDQEATDQMVDAAAGFIAPAGVIGAYHGRGNVAQAEKYAATAKKLRPEVPETPPPPARDGGDAAVLDKLDTDYQEMLRTVAAETAEKKAVVDQFGDPKLIRDPSTKLQYDAAVEAYDKANKEGYHPYKDLIAEHAKNGPAIKKRQQQREIDEQARELAALTDPDVLVQLQERKQELEQKQATLRLEALDHATKGDMEAHDKVIAQHDALNEAIKQNADWAAKASELQKEAPTKEQALPDAVEGAVSSLFPGKKVPAYATKMFDVNNLPSAAQLKGLEAAVAKAREAAMLALGQRNAADPASDAAYKQKLANFKLVQARHEKALQAIEARKQLAATGPSIEGVASRIGSPESARVGPPTDGMVSGIGSPESASVGPERRLQPINSQIQDGFGGGKSESELQAQLAAARATRDTPTAVETLEQLRDLRSRRTQAGQDIIRNEDQVPTGTPESKALQDTQYLQNTGVDKPAQTGTLPQPQGQPHYETAMAAFNDVVQHLANQENASKGPDDAPVTSAKVDIAAAIARDIEFNMGRPLEAEEKASVQKAVNSLIGDTRRVMGSPDLRTTAAKIDSLREGLTDIRNKAMQGQFDKLSTPRDTRPVDTGTDAPTDNLHIFDTPEDFQRYLSSKPHADMLKQMGVVLTKASAAEGFLQRATKFVDSLSTRLGSLLAAQGSASARAAALRQAHPVIKQLGFAQEKLRFQEDRAAALLREMSELRREREDIDAAAVAAHPVSQRTARVKELDQAIYQANKELRKIVDAERGDPTSGEAERAKVMADIDSKRAAVIQLMETRARAEVAQPTKSALQKWGLQDIAWRKRLDAIEARLEKAQSQADYAQTRAKNIRKEIDSLSSLATDLNSMEPTLARAKAEVDSFNPEIEDVRKKLRVAETAKAKAERALTEEGMREERQKAEREAALREASERDVERRAAAKKLPERATFPPPLLETASGRTVSHETLRNLRAKAADAESLERALEAAKRDAVPGDKTQENAIAQAEKALSTARAAQKRLDRMAEGGEAAEKVRKRLVEKLQRLDGDENTEGSIRYKEAQATEEGLSRKVRSSRVKDAQEARNERDAVAAQLEIATNKQAKVTEKVQVDADEAAFNRAFELHENQAAKVRARAAAKAAITRLKKKIELEKAMDDDPQEGIRLARELRQAERDLHNLNEGVRRAQAERKANRAGTLRTGNKDTIGERSVGIRNPITEGIKHKNRNEGENTGKPLSDEVLSHIEKGRVNSALRVLSMDSEQPAMVRRIASRLADLIGKDLQVFIVDTLPRGAEGAGLYIPGEGLYLSRSKGLDVNTFLHEAAHPVIERLIDTPNSQLTPRQREAKSDLARMMQETKAAIKRGDLENGVIREGDLHEFVAEALGSAKVRSWMARNEGRGLPGMLQNFWHAILRFMGVSTPPKGPGLDSFMRQAFEIMDTPLSKQEAYDKYLGGGAKGRKETVDPDSPAGKAAAASKQFIRGETNIVKDVYEQRKVLPNWLHQQLVDSRSSVNEIVKKLVKEQKTAPAMVLQQNLLQHDAGGRTFSNSLEHGAPNIKTTKDGESYLVWDGDKGIHIVHDAIAALPVPASIREAVFQTYMTVERALQHGGEKIAATPEAWRDMTAAYHDIKKNDPKLFAALGEAKKAWNSYNKPFLKTLHAEGILNDATFERLNAHDAYIPWLRDGKEGTTEVFSPDNTVTAIGDIRTMPMLEALKGSDKKILPFNESAALITAMQTQMITQNRLSRQIGKILHEYGELAGADRTDMRIHELKEGHTLPPGHAHGDVINWMDKGKSYWLRINTEGTALADIPTNLLVQAVAGKTGLFNKTMLGRAGMAMSGTLRAAVTRNPLYVVGQLVKDPLSQSMQGNIKRNPVSAVAGAVKTFITILAGKNKAYDRLKELGALNSNIYSGDTADYKHVMRQRIGESNGLYRKALNLMDNVAHAADSSTRTLAFEDAIKAGTTELEAAVQAQVMQNFQARGASTGMQAWASFVPFSAAQISALNTMVRSARGNLPVAEKLQSKKAFYTRMLLGTGLALAYIQHLDDTDEEWKRLPLSAKLKAIPTGVEFDGRPLQVPSPFEAGFLAWGLPVMIYDYLSGNADSKTTAKAFATAFGTTFIPSVTPPGVRAAIGLTTNRDVTNPAFPITPDKQLGYPVTEQKPKNVHEYESMVAEGIRAAIPDGAPGSKINANDVRFVASSMFAQVPEMVGQLTDLIFGKDEEGVKAEKSATENPLWARFFRKEVQRNSNTRSEMWDAANASMAAQKFISTLKGKEKVDAMQKAMKEHGPPGVLASFRTQDAALSKQMRALEEGKDPSVKTPEEAKKKLKGLADRQEALAKAMKLRLAALRSDTDD